MRFAADLHVHSALSPCADDEMTPNNIINMAALKGLDFVALTDHNSTGNLDAFVKCAQTTDVIAVPGMEVETAEEVHLVCLFPSLAAAVEAGDQIKAALPDIKNRKDIFGSQLIFDEDDNITGEEEQLLMTAARLSINEVFKIVEKAGGAVIPAHINRSSNSILSNLGSIPSELPVKYVEISPLPICRTPEGFLPIMSSDAHTLGDILERTSFIDLPQKKLESLIDELKGQRCNACK
ncbi:MAG: PHP domain-containing protein [Clostridiales bacterium]|nr:PHP domain-containing protein [Clostridiales bacterium]